MLTEFAQIGIHLHLNSSPVSSPPASLITHTTLHTHTHSPSWSSSPNTRLAWLTTLSSTPTTKSSSTWTFNTTKPSCLPQHVPWTIPSVLPLTQWPLSQRCKGPKIFTSTTMSLHKASSPTNTKHQPDHPTQPQTPSMRCPPSSQHPQSLALQCLHQPWAPRRLFPSSTRGNQCPWDSHPAMNTQA